MTLEFKPRFLTASEYVRALHRAQDFVAVLVRDRMKQRAMQRIAPVETVASESFQSWLVQQNAAGADIFIGMNPVRPASKNRTRESIREVRHLYLDLDEDAGASLQAIRTSADIPSPNFVLDTSPGRHQVIWRVEGFDIAEAEQVLRSLASNYGGDPAATDISRLLRLAGFANHKYHDAFVVRAHHVTDDVHRPESFRSQEDSPESPRRPNASIGRRALSPGHKSQSEADWAYAKRALARGDDPEQIIQRIADYRADDKADPVYYARHTVQKAQIQDQAPNHISGSQESALTQEVKR